MPKTPDITRGRLSLVLDTTVLSNFAAVGRMGLLKELYREQGCTTLAVVEEIQRGLNAGYEYLQSAAKALASFQPAGWLPILALESAKEHALYLNLSTLGPGEASCLAVAIRRGLTLASDDLAARRMAAKRGVRLTGTLGILIRLVREGHLSLDEANRILEEMVALRYRSPVQSLDNLI